MSTLVNGYTKWMNESMDKSRNAGFTECMET